MLMTTTTVPGYDAPVGIARADHDFEVQNYSIEVLLRQLEVHATSMGAEAVIDVKILMTPIDPQTKKFKATIIGTAVRKPTPQGHIPMA